jgi:hypothetical protein
MRQAHSAKDSRPSAAGKEVPLPTAHGVHARTKGPVPDVSLSSREGMQGAPTSGCRSKGYAAPQHRRARRRTTPTAPAAGAASAQSQGPSRPRTRSLGWRAAEPTAPSPGAAKACPAPGHLPQRQPVDHRPWCLQRPTGHVSRDAKVEASGRRRRPMSMMPRTWRRPRPPPPRRGGGGRGPKDGRDAPGALGGRTRRPVARAGGWRDQGALCCEARAARAWVLRLVSRVRLPATSHWLSCSHLIHTRVHKPVAGRGMVTARRRQPHAQAPSLLYALDAAPSSSRRRLPPSRLPSCSRPNNYFTRLRCMCTWRQLSPVFCHTRVSSACTVTGDPPTSFCVSRMYDTMAHEGPTMRTCGRRAARAGRSPSQQASGCWKDVNLGGSRERGRRRIARLSHVGRPWCSARARARR